MKLKDVVDPLAKEAYEEWKELGDDDDQIESIAQLI